MRQSLLLLIVATTTLFASCRKDAALPVAGTATPLPPAAPLYEDDHRSVRLREVHEQGMPGPYFHFDYDSAGFVTAIDYAAGFLRYTVGYANKRINKLTNRFDSSVLRYAYQNGLVTAIHKVDSTGQPEWDYRFAYTEGRLVRMEWVRKSAGAEQLERRAELSYGSDGNLASWNDFRRVNGNLELSRTYTYSDYDNQTNVDDFYLTKSFFEDVLFLPRVRLQRNNPRRVLITGAVNDFEIDYTYTYFGALPLSRSGVMRQVRGNGSAPALNTLSTYSYY
ncbi:MAG: hypothetical protein EOO16_05975 [Chitinophagaceae bacterium]|nr:MAG: hypothetical protein EOO16_05975 [Chitinophagaceae bacterium]